MAKLTRASVARPEEAFTESGGAPKNFQAVTVRAKWGYEVGFAKTIGFTVEREYVDPMHRKWIEETPTARGFLKGEWGLGKKAYANGWRVFDVPEGVELTEENMNELMVPQGPGTGNTLANIQGESKYPAGSLFAELWEYMWQLDSPDDVYTEVDGKRVKTYSEWCNAMVNDSLRFEKMLGVWKRVPQKDRGIPLTPEEQAKRDAENAERKAKGWDPKINEIEYLDSVLAENVDLTPYLSGSAAAEHAELPDHVAAVLKKVIDDAGGRTKSSSLTTAAMSLTDSDEQAQALRYLGTSMASGKYWRVEGDEVVALG